MESRLFTELRAENDDSGDGQRWPKSQWRTLFKAFSNGMWNLQTR